MKDKVILWHRKMMLIAIIIGFIALITIPQAQAKATQRPIKDFIDQQGTFCIDDGMGGCFLFVPPIANFIGWSDPAQSRSASIDYAGLANNFLDNALGTTFLGSITERPLADGRTEIIVNLRTHNALTWITDSASFIDTDANILFGQRINIDSVLEGEPALCDSHLQVKLINTAIPGAPLPDLFQFVFFPEYGQELLSIAMRCNAEGPLWEEFDSVEDGTSGRATVTETGLFMTGFHGAVGDGFPVESIDLKVIGKKAKD